MMEGTTPMKHTLPFVAVSAAATAVLTLSACGTNSGGMNSGNNSGAGGVSSGNTNSGGMNRGMNPAGSPAAGARNNADVAFTSNMIPRYAQAAVIANMANAQATDPKLKQLATEMLATQQPQLKTMSDQMTRWGMPVPAMGNGHDMGSMGAGINGMMTSAQMGALGKARGAGFDRMWLQTMIKDHQGAVTLSRTELAQGSNLDNKKLAQAIIDAQSAEITQMSSMMAALGS
jgi:uncharacterized protein (DUF305 family)